MVNFITFWCIDEKGLPLFYKENTSDDDIVEKMELISGLFCAIDKMASVAVKEKLKYIVFEKTKLVFTKLKDRDIFFVAQVTNKARNYFVLKKLKAIKGQFISIYGKEIKTWNGNLSKFSDFVDNLDLN
jgi:hypothetical protein